MIEGLDLLFLEVNSLEESVAFYRGVLGMEVESINAAAEPPMAKLRAGGLKITLAQHLETMLKNLGELTIDVDQGKAQVRITCE